MTTTTLPPEIKEIQPGKKINFSKNWNKKLYNNYYTTIRLSNEYFKPGELFWVCVKGCIAPDHRALLMEKKTILLAQLPEFTAYLDTGMNKAATTALFRTMYPKADWNIQTLDILLFQNLEA